MKQSNTSASKGRFIPPNHLLKNIKVLTVGLVTIFSISLKAQVANVFPSTGNVGIGSTRLRQIWMFISHQAQLPQILVCK